MVLSKNDEQLLELLLKKRKQSVKRTYHKPFYIQALQFSMVFFSLLLFITVGTLGILVLSKPQSASASNTYTETWTATSGVYGTQSGGQEIYSVGSPSQTTSQVCSYGVEWASCTYDVTAWSVSGTIN